MSDMHKKHSEDAWDNRELGAEEQFVRKVSPERDKAVDKKLGLQIISVRLQKSLIDDLKELAAENGLGYQPYLRQVLTKHVREQQTHHQKPLKIISHR